VTSPVNAVVGDTLCRLQCRKFLRCVRNCDFFYSSKKIRAFPAPDLTKLVAVCPDLLCGIPRKSTDKYGN